MQEDLGTEYLVRPVGHAEDEEDACDFEPQENGDVEEDDEEDDDGKVETPPKRKRASKDDSDDDDGGEDDDRPSKR